MIRAQTHPLRWMLAVGAMSLLLIVGVGSARAATYPTTGGSTFSGSAEGWNVTKSDCSLLPVLCKTTAGYGGTAGNPAGSLQLSSQIILNAGALFKSEGTFESPTFSIAQGHAATLSLQRAYDPGGLVELAPQLEYKASLLDKTSGGRQDAVTEKLAAASDYTTKEGPVTLVAGHSYAIVIEADVASTVAGVSLGTSLANFDNVVVTDSTGGGAGNGNGSGGAGNGSGGNGANGANGLTDARLATLMQSSLVGPAVLKGNRLYVKAKCPKKVGVACRVSVQGMLKKGKPATTGRTAKIAKGKAKRLVLKVKPKAKAKVAKKKKLLFKETVKAGSAKATVYKTLKLIRK